MTTHLEDYALLSDMHTAALVGRDGSIDWLCLPRFDSPAIFTKLLGSAKDGAWRMGVVGGEVVERSYEEDTFVLVTTWRGPDGVARVTDFLPTNTGEADLVRRVECVEGEVVVDHDLRLRFDYGRSTPWFRRIEDSGHGDGQRGGHGNGHGGGHGDDHGGPALTSLAGPDGLILYGPVLRPVTNGDAPEETSTAPDAEPATDEQCERDLSEGGSALPRLGGRFRLSAGQTLTWELAYFRSWEEPPARLDVEAALTATRHYWRSWAEGFSPVTRTSSHAPLLVRSLLVLRALTHVETGGIVAAPTASLPEDFGGVRNWDYRYTWLRDAALTIEALVAHGMTDGAKHWRDWLLRAIAGDVDDLRIMYGLGGERDLDEKELPHLAGYENSQPVRIGNGAAGQYQADVPGEVMLALAAMRDAGVTEDEYSWSLQQGILRYCEARLEEKDHGIWEMRGDLHHFTHGRVMMWAAFNEGARAVREYGLPGDAERWERIRDDLAAEIHEHGFDAERGTFTQTYDNTEVDASLLQLPHTKFIAYDDERMLGTVAAIEEDLLKEQGLVHRYRTEAGYDGLEGEEYPFLLCSFWLVEQYALSGRREDAQVILDHLVGMASDLGLLAEEFDPKTQRLAGNFPQAFSHLGLVRALDAVDTAGRPREECAVRPGGDGVPGFASFPTMGAR